MARTSSVDVEPESAQGHAFLHPAALGSGEARAPGGDPDIDIESRFGESLRKIGKLLLIRSNMPGLLVLAAPNGDATLRGRRAKQVPVER